MYFNLPQNGTTKISPINLIFSTITKYFLFSILSIGSQHYISICFLRSYTLIFKITSAVNQKKKFPFFINKICAIFEALSLVSQYLYLLLLYYSV